MRTATLCQAQALFTENDGVVRIPFLVKGQMIEPPTLSRATIEAAFVHQDAGVNYVKLPNAQLIRERIIDRTKLRYTEQYLYQVMPPVDAAALIETDVAALVRGPYALSVSAVLDYIQALADTFLGQPALLQRVYELCRRTMEYPDAYLTAAFAALQVGLNRTTAQTMIDQELALWSKPGREFLEDWVEVPAQVAPSVVWNLAQDLPTAALPPSPLPSKAWIRAMPTRQLHITAGNAPTVPMLSALRLLLTKSVGVVKLPFGATLTGALFAWAVATAAPDHPLTKHLSIVYWQGGDETVEQMLFLPNQFDRIVVWGAPGAVTAVQAQAGFTKTISFNPRYGISLIGREAFGEALAEVAMKAVLDTMIHNQKACNAAHVHYVEGTAEQVNEYAESLCQVLNEWDQIAPQVVPTAAKGQIKRMQRGKYLNAAWHLNSLAGEFASGVVVMPDEFDILDHPLCRLIVVRRVDQLTDVYPYLHAGVSTAGVYPEMQRLLLRDTIAAHGVSNVLPLGECERAYAGMPHDGMVVLNQLVDWKNA